MMKRRTFALGFAALTLGAAALQAQAADQLAEIQARKTVRIAVPTDYPPYGFVGPDMQMKGLDIEAAGIVAKGLGVKVELVPVTSANRIPYLQTGKVDLIMSTLGKTAERAKVIDYSVSYSPFFDAVFGRKDVAVKSFADLTGKTIAVTRGAMEIEELEKLAPKGYIPRIFEDNNATVQAFLSGQTQLMAVSAAVAGAVTAKNPQADIEFKIELANSPDYVGVPKGQKALLDKVNEIIMAARKDGTIDALSRKWLGAPAGNLPM